MFMVLRTGALWELRGFWRRPLIYSHYEYPFFLLLPLPPGRALPMEGVAVQLVPRYPILHPPA